MIIKLKQTKSDIKHEYQFVHKENVIGDSYIPVTLMGREIIFKQNDNVLYKIESCLADDIKNIFHHYPVHKSYIIKNVENDINGYIVIKKNSFWLGYFYYEVMLDGNIYTIYEVGKGKEGLFLTVFQEKEQVALIEKEIKVKDYKDTYSIFLKSEADMMPVMLFNLLYDAIRWSNRGKTGYKVTKYNYIYTTNKFVKSTYNPDFIKGVSK